MYFSVYLFNWTNADEVIESKWAVKPKLEQCGPYVFSEHHVRVNLTWNNNNTVSFQQKRIWHFLPEFSNGTLSDNITNINPIVSVSSTSIESNLNLNQFVKGCGEQSKGFEYNFQNINQSGLKMGRESVVSNKDCR